MERRARVHARWVPYTFVAPATAVFCLFALLPIAHGLVVSLYQSNPVEGVHRFVGLANFRELASDPVFASALRNNLVWIALSLLVQVPIALLLAVALSDASRLSRALRTIFFSPLMVPGVAVGILFGMVFDGQYSVANALLSAVTGQPAEIGWIADRHIALLCLVGVACWQYTGYHMMVLLAGIQGIPTEVHEAAIVDGAGWVRRLTSITLPLLRRVLWADMLLVAIGSIRVFDTVWVMTQGGPSHATEVLATYMYSQAFLGQRAGMGAAIATVMLAITLGLAMLHLRASRLAEGE